MRFRRTLLWFFVGSLALTGVLGVIAMLLPDFIPNQGRFLWSAFLLTVYSLALLVCAAVIERGHYQRLAWTSAALFGVSLVVWLILIWIYEYVDGGIPGVIYKMNGMTTVFAITAMHNVLLLLVLARQPLTRWVRRATIGAAAIVALWLVAEIWSDVEFGNEFLTKLVGAVAIVGSLGTIALPLLSRLERLAEKDAGDSNLSSTVPVSLCCPRCAHALTLAGNKLKRCDGCGLKITVRFEEPRCECGYLLLGLTTDRCPECGKTIPEQDRWHAHGSDSDPVSKED